MHAYFFDITTYGAVGDGATLNTQAIQQAIDAAAAQRGGVVFFPPGVFLTGTLELKSGVTLELHPAAVLRGSPRLEDYRQLHHTRDDDRTPWHLLTAHQAHDITIRGGTIDGNGTAFWEPVVGAIPSLPWWHARRTPNVPPCCGFTPARSAVPAR